jgi:hypothetical protein
MITETTEQREQTSAALARIDQVSNAPAVLAAIDEVQLVVQSCATQEMIALPVLARSIRRSVGIQQLRKVLTDDVMKIFMNLQSSSLGFKTDRDRPPKDFQGDIKKWKPGYPMEVVRECLIEALMRGLQPNDNEFNILAENMYVAKNGIKRLVMEWPGLTDFRKSILVPIKDERTKTAHVGAHATWLLGGKFQKLDLDLEKLENEQLRDARLSIKVNYGMGDDAIQGKAERKLYKAVYDVLTGGNSGIEDGEVIDTTGHEVLEGPASAPAPALPEKDGKRTHVSMKATQPAKSNGNGQQAAPSETPKEPASSPAAAETTGSGIAPGEIKDIKRAAMTANALEIVKLCEDELSGKGDFETLGTIMDWRNANMAPAREPGVD